MDTNFAAEKTELLAILLAANQAERDGNTQAAIILNEMLVISAATLETDMVLAQDDIEAARLN